MDDRYDDDEERLNAGDAAVSWRSNDDGDEEMADDGEEEEAEADEMDGNDIDLVDIDLRFEIGRARLTLAELRTLDTGSIVLFEGGSPASVAIVASGRTLGYGELVDVEGRVGIRITEWGNGNERPV